MSFWQGLVTVIDNLSLLGQSPSPTTQANPFSFHARILGTALQAVSAKNPDKAAAKLVRSQTRALLAKYGLHSRDITSRTRFDRYLVRSKLARSSYGLHSWNGSISIQTKTHLRAIRFLANGDRDRKATKGIQTLVHEETHGCSPILPCVYKKWGIPLEEATTELAARAIIRKEFGIPYSATYSARDSGYVDEIDALLGGVRDTLSAHGLPLVDPDQVRALVEEACLEMRRSNPAWYAHRTTFLEWFVRCLPFKGFYPSFAPQSWPVLRRDLAQQVKQALIGVHERRRLIRSKSVKVKPKPQKLEFATSP